MPVMNANTTIFRGSSSNVRGCIDLDLNRSRFTVNDSYLTIYVNITLQ